MENRYEASLSRLDAEGRLRRIPGDRTCRELTDLCSNDYMGLSQRAEEWRPEFHKRFGYPAMTASASRLLASDQRYFLMLEEYLEKAYGRSALLFNSGYHANTGLVSALDLPGTLWAADKLIHASVIDGLRMAHANFKRWNHNDVGMLRRIVSKHYHDYDRIIVVCESVYSMDGDIAPLQELVSLKEEYPGIMLYVDEAHALGCFGETGLGLCSQSGIAGQVDILVGTLGKACASAGAFVIADPLIKEYLINTARSLIFSTALAPVNAAWSLMMLEKLSVMNKERERLSEISSKFRSFIEDLTGTENPSRSAIVPLITGDAYRAVELSRRLESEGILALPIRRPTVPEGGERIRFSLNARLTDEDLDRIASKLAKTYNELK